MDRPKPFAGYTIMELLVVIVVIGILAALVLTNVFGYQPRSRDTQRVTDLDTLHNRLEEYYNDNGGYPNTFTAATFPGIDPAVLKDPNGVSVSIQSAVANQAAARAAANPTSSGANYKYIPYPTSCTSNCTGYVLKSYIELPTQMVPNPYALYGLNNN